MEKMRTFINNGEKRRLDRNIGKKVLVDFFTEKDEELYIQGGTMRHGKFVYFMSKAKNPRKEFKHGDEFLHEMIDARYYVVEPLSIVI